METIVPFRSILGSRWTAWGSSAVHRRRCEPGNRWCKTLRYRTCCNTVWNGRPSAAAGRGWRTPNRSRDTWWNTASIDFDSLLWPDSRSEVKNRNRSIRWVWLTKGRRWCGQSEPLWLPWHPSRKWRFSWPTWSRVRMPVEQKFEKFPKSISYFERSLWCSRDHCQFIPAAERWAGKRCGRTWTTLRERTSRPMTW